MALSMLPPEPDRITDDYVIEREDQRTGPPVMARVVTGLRIVIVVIMGFTSLALFWVVGTMIGLF